MSQNLPILLVNSMGIMALVSIGYGALVRRGVDRRINRLAAGGLLGASAVFAMLQPIPIAPGFFADTRNLYVAFAGAFFGPLPALIALAMTAASRIALGGGGIALGLGSITIAATAGLSWRQLTARRPRGKPLLLAGLGLLTSLGMTVSIFAPADIRNAYLTTAAPYLIVFNILGAVVLGSFMGRERLHANRERNLSNAANTDALTGLPNRRLLRAAFENIDTAGDFSGLALLVIDLDHFKAINDSHGHPAGDLVLQKVSEQLEQSVRYNDLVSRFGGEEFVVLLDNVSRDEADSIAERIRETIASGPITSVNQDLYVTASIGGYWAASPTSLDTALHEADKSLYAAKSGGRNAVVFGTPLPRAA